MKKLLKSKKIIILVTAVIIAILLSLTLLWFTSENRENLKITTLPSDTKYTINGKEYSGNQEIGLNRGTYTIVFTRKYFLDKTESVVIDGDGITVLDIFLEPDPNASYDYNSLSPGEKQLLQEAAEQTSDKKAQKTVDENPLIKKLPHIDENFRVDYAFNPSDKYKAIYEITLFTSSSAKSEAELKKEVEEWFRAEGYDLNTLEHSWFTK